MARIDLASLGVHFHFDRCRYNWKMSHSLGNEKSALIQIPNEYFKWNLLLLYCLEFERARSA